MATNGQRIVRALTALFILFLTAELTFADDTGPTGVYEGTVAGQPVSVSFNEARFVYYYHKIGKNIDLNPLPDKPGFYLESDPSHPHFAEDFDSASDDWWEIATRGTEISGLWKSGSKQARKILLHKVADWAFEAHRLDLPFTQGKTVTEHGIVLNLLIHPVTKVTLAQIVSGIPDKAAKLINSQLAGHAASLSEMWTDCSDFDAGVEPGFMSPLWVTFDVNASGFCGGVHPNEDSTPYSYDASTGEQLDFREWIDSQYWSEGSVRGSLRDEVAKQFEVEECLDHVKEMSWANFTPWMDAEGFNFRLEETDRAYIACEGDYVVPSDRMRKLIDPSHLDLFDRFVAASAKLREVESPNP